MNLLLFFISSLFSAIFYIFYLVQIDQDFLWYSFKSNIYFDTFWDLYLESIIFFLIWIFFLFFLSNFWFKWNSKNEEFFEQEEEKKIPLFTKWDLDIFIKDIFKKYNYYFAFILAYISIFFILKSLDFISIEIFILIINIIVLVLFTIWNKFFIFRDFIKINIILFSIYYIFLFIISFFSQKFDFEFISFFNSILIFISFLINIYLDKKILLYKKTDNTLIFYFSIYSLLFISYYLNIFISDLFLSLILISASISVSIYFYFTKIKIMQDNLIILRTISFIFLYIVSILSIVYGIQNWLSLIVFFILIYSIIINFKIHQSFQNYISFCSSIFIILFFVYYFYFTNLAFSDDGLLLLVLSLGLSIEMVVITYFYKFKYIYDNHFLHFISYINTFIFIIYYFLSFWFDFFTLWIILFIVSVYLFSSFYKLKNIWKTN